MSRRLLSLNEFARRGGRDSGGSSSGSVSGSGGGSGSASGRPPGLRGKEIGLYYRNLNRKRKDEPEEKRIHLGPSVSVPPKMLQRVNDYLRMSERNEEEKVSNEFKLCFHHLQNVDFEQFIEQSKESRDINTTGRNPALSHRLKGELLAKESQKEYENWYAERMKLPAMQQQDKILKDIMEHQVTLIVGSTGCGKTTQVPQLLLDERIRRGTGGDCHIVCTQPRRISAVSVAERVAKERCESLGSSVGYQIRLESAMPRNHGSILYCTTGVLLQKMEMNPLMHGLDYVILDEIHERNVQTDVLMTLIKKILPHRPDLKVILMSATVSEEVFCQYFNNCRTIRIDGTLFPVEVLYLEDILQETGLTHFQNASQDRKQRQRRQDYDKIRKYNDLIEPYLYEIRNQYNKAVIEALRSPDSEGCANLQFLQHLIFYINANKPPGAILVFLPGYTMISKLGDLLAKPPAKSENQPRLQVYPLHSMMPTINQRSVFQPADPGSRKVILSTCIAETSITIDDVVYVVNTGRTKITSYDASTNILALEETWVAKANSQQRKGRAGRVQPGICYNLFTRRRQETMVDVPVPEILCCKLESIILSLKLLHIKDEWDFFAVMIDPPKAKAAENAINLLKRIDALDDHGNITPLGIHLARLPIDPQMGKMILMAALFRCLDPITSVAAGLSYKSPFYIPLGKEHQVDEKRSDLADGSRSDHLLLSNIISEYRRAMCNGYAGQFCRDNFLSVSILKQLENMKQQFADLLKATRFIESSRCRDASANVNSGNIPLLRAVIAAGLYPNMAYLRKVRTIKNRVNAIHSMSTPEDKRVNFHPSSVNKAERSFDSNYFVYLQKQRSSDLYLLDATMVFPMALIIFGDHVESGVVDHSPFISVGKSYHFKCDVPSADVIMKLRHQLEWLLQKQALYPSVVAEGSREDNIIKAIQLLLSLDDYTFDDQDTDNENV